MDEFYKFREGDLLWWFVAGDCLEYHPQDINIIHLESGVLRYHCGNGKMQVDGVNGVAWWELFYPTKREALEALAARLKELLDQ